MKIIHCADIHLDSKLESNLPSNKARERKKEIVMSFCRMIDYAAEIKAAAVIIAGDLFDTNRMLKTTRDLVLGKIVALQETAVFYLSGNHDAGKALSECEYPKNLMLFNDRWTTYSIENVDISGVELNSENCRHIYGSLNLNPERFNIVTMHGQLGTAFNEETVNKTELSLKGIDYLALGHYHSFDSGRLGKNGVWCYSGCLEGRGFDECGDKGFTVLDIGPNGELAFEFKRFSCRDIVEKEADISGLSDASSILSRVDEVTAGVSENAMIKVVLTGKLSLDARKDTDYIVKHLNSRFWFAKLSDKTQLALNPEEFANDVSLKGEFIRKVLASDLPEDTKLKVLECGLAALSSQEVPL